MRSRTVWQIWSKPLLLGAVTVFGLLSALLGGGGAWWAGCWTALALPLLAMARFYMAGGKIRIRKPSTL